MEEPAASLFRTYYSILDRYSMFLKNADNKLPDCMASYLSRQQIFTLITVRSLNLTHQNQLDYDIWGTLIPTA
jgi:uncharacterized lipoprotein YajG